MLSTPRLIQSLQRSRKLAKIEGVPYGLMYFSGTVSEAKSMLEGKPNEEDWIDAKDLLAMMEEIKHA